jgi:hypothetical protein
MFGTAWHTESSTSGSNLVVPISKINLKGSCDNEVRYLDLTYFSDHLNSKEVVKHFLVAVLRSLALSRNGEALLVAVQRTYAFPHYM